MSKPRVDPVSGKTQAECFRRMLFVPRQCEARFCTVSGECLQRCSGCKLVMYCGVEHQRDDWARHKQDCRHLRHIGITGFEFDRSQEVEDFPVGSFGAGTHGARSQEPAVRTCGICQGSSDLVRSPCCSNWICKEGSVNECFENHVRYTTCGMHFTEKHAEMDCACPRCARTVAPNAVQRRLRRLANVLPVPELARPVVQDQWL